MLVTAAAIAKSCRVILQGQGIRLPRMSGTVLITGANRGLGLEHSRQFAERGWRVLACARNPDSAAELRALQRAFPARVQLLHLDVTSEGSVKELVRELNGTPIDILLNNAGTYGPMGAPEGMVYQSLASMDYAIWREILEINLLAPFRITVALAPNVRAGQRHVVVMMTSDLGSISNNTLGGSHAYRTSKAGLNMLTKGIANEWRDLIVISMAPGWCQTDLGGTSAPIDPVDSVREQQRVFDSLTAEHSGLCLDRFGKPVAW
jgi:NAD(P)-dependent dehydrogenase (short-subunit alcohol dehydrogenase family)